MVSVSVCQILLDTNIWVDNYLAYRPGNRQSCALIDAALELRVSILYPVHIIKDVFYIIQNSMKAKEREEQGFVSERAALAIREISWACTENMTQNATAVAADDTDVWLAMRYRTIHKDLEDNLVLAAAERSQADMLVTNDHELLGKATIPAHTPEDALAFLRM